MSKGSDHLVTVLKEIYGSELKVIREYHVGQRLRLDFFLPAYGIGFEYHGVQHSHFVEHFHKSASGFRDSKRRDRLKLELAEAKGITVVTLWSTEEVSKESVSRKIREAIISS
tara:strand:- start:632 stop:970 length:339 start_codon:yes stop_codon:yes gene_type:complete